MKKPGLYYTGHTKNEANRILIRNIDIFTETHSVSDVLVSIRSVEERVIILQGIFSGTESRENICYMKSGDFI